MTPRSIAAAIGALTLAGCGGGSVATTPGNEASVEQYASLVAGHASDWRESVETIHDSCADSNAVDACAAAYRAASEQAETLRIALSEANQVPAEIATLVADTEATAGAYSAAFEAWQATNCANPIDFNCGADEAGAMFSALGDLTRQFDAWKAHTGSLGRTIGAVAPLAGGKRRHPRDPTQATCHAAGTILAERPHGGLHPCNPRRASARECPRSHPGPAAGGDRPILLGRLVQFVLVDEDHGLDMVAKVEFHQDPLPVGF